ncbi:sigma-70 family RNA polymerase sigma factor [Streptomyces sp. TR1341]|uniref:sigma-70 family RNA polymerase sigma factor n=1 Tax=Streptomyces sp. TR1341 TaxID=2601266 RepID=UPI00138AC00F
MTGTRRTPRATTADEAAITRTDSQDAGRRQPDPMPSPEPEDTAPGPGRNRELEESDRETVLTRLFQTQYAPLLRLASSLGADDPENIVAEAYFQLCKRWHHLQQKQAAAAYLRTTIHNLTRMHHRRQHTIHHHARSTTAETVLSAETTALQHHDHHTLHQALQQLPIRQKQALVLRHWHDLTQNEIATLLQVTVGTVKTHTHRALHALTLTLAPHR